MARAIEALSPIDAETGLRLYNPDGIRVVNISELLEITHDETHPDRGPNRARPAEGRGSCCEAEQDDLERPRGDGAPRVPRRPRTRERVDGEHEGAPVRNCDLKWRLDTLARTLRGISRSTTRLRRFVTADAQQLVDLEGAVDAAIRSLRSLQRRTQEKR